jgi:hypothetical protein
MAASLIRIGANLMPEDVAAQRVEAFYSRPFQPKPPTGEDRIAPVIEYAAAQLGIIARTLVKIESHLARQNEPPYVPAPEMPAPGGDVLKDFQRSLNKL